MSLVAVALPAIIARFLLKEAARFLARELTFRSVNEIRGEGRNLSDLVRLVEQETGLDLDSISTEEELNTVLNDLYQEGTISDELLMSVSRATDNAGSIDLDWLNSVDWHVQHNMKTGDTIGGNDQTWYPALMAEPALNGELKRTQVYLCTGLTVWSCSLNMANQAARDKPEELNLTYEISMSPTPAFASRENNAIVKDEVTGEGDGNTTVDVRRPTSPEVSNSVLFATRIDNSTGYENGTSGTGGGMGTTANSEPQYMDFRHKYGSPIPMGPDDQVYYHLLLNEDGQTQNYSFRAPHTFHGTVYGEAPDPYPEVVDVI